MSLNLTISILKDFSQTAQFIVKDVTTWGDPLRINRKLVCFVERFENGSFEPMALEANGSPTSVSEFLVKLDKDGYYKILLVSASQHDGANPYFLDHVVYGTTDSHTGLFVAIDQNVPANTELSDPYFWQPVESIEYFPLLSETGTDYLCQDHVHDLMSRVCIAEKAIRYAKEPCDCPDETLTKDYFWSLLFHHAAVYSTAFNEPKESGFFLDQVIDRCTNGSALEKEDCGCH